MSGSRKGGFLKRFSFLLSKANSREFTGKVADFWKLSTRSEVLVFIFMFSMFAFQFALIPQQLYPFRKYLRVACYATSLVMLVVCREKHKTSMLPNFAVLICIVYFIEMLHPNTMAMAGLATAMLNVSIVAPAIWCSRLTMTTALMRKVLILLWAFNFFSCNLGVLEIYFPDRFSRESKVTEEVRGGQAMADGMKVTLADGRKVYRPMGFSDTPGGAAVAGYFVVVASSTLLINRGHWALRAICLTSIPIGLFCIYLSQVRSLLILAGLSELTTLFILFARGEIRKVSAKVALIPVLVALSALWAFDIGGEAISRRLSTLTESSMGQIYYDNRGHFLEYTLFTFLPETPIGIGLGRHGVCNRYFGDGSQASYYAELQITAWVLDGGAILLALYIIALVFCLIEVYWAALSCKGELSAYACIVLALNFGMLARIFAASPFSGQSGMEYWIFNTCLLAAALRQRNEIRYDKLKRANRIKQLKAIWDSNENTNFRPVAAPVQIGQKVRPDSTF